MKIKINNQILDKYPGLKLGLVIVKGLNNTGQNQEIMKLIKSQQDQIKENYSSETLSQNPKIQAWRQTYSSFGAKPKKYKCSVENLYKMVLNGIELRHINKIVDIYNYISLKHMIPVGGDDTDKIKGDIELRFASGDEKFTQLNSSEPTSPKLGEVVYSDNGEILCRRWNWRECDKSKMTENSKNICLVVEGLDVFSKQEIHDIISELAELITKYCGGETNTVILDHKNTELEF